ncbi:MAG: HD domain-containing protein [Methyloligellaceae bacterium]
MILSHRDLVRAADFAARKHATQTRKGEAREPYINHLTEVTHILAVSPAGGDLGLLMAALLHDTVEDTDTTFDELEVLFGPDVTALVRAATDDKTLRKDERKRLQVEMSPAKPARARMLKMADKISNLRSMAGSPPAGGESARMLAYGDWTEAVVAGCCMPDGPPDDGLERAVIEVLKDQFDQSVRAARAAIAGRSAV